MKGKLVAGFLVLSALVTGAAVYYLQVHAYYGEVPAGTPGAVIRLLPVAGGPPAPIPAAEFEGIDADSSPLRFRACFTTPLSLAALSETFVMAEAPTPLNAPAWFDCFDAARIGADLASGRALAFLSELDIRPGVDRLVAVYADGRGFAWHQLDGRGE